MNLFQILRDIEQGKKMCGKKQKAYYKKCDQIEKMDKYLEKLE